MELQTINTQVTNLMRKIEAEEGAIDPYVKHQITLALEVYSNKLKNKSLHNKWPNECVTIDQKLCLAQNMLSTLPTQQSNFQVTIKSEQDIRRMRDNLTNLEQQIRQNKIQVNKYQNILYIATNQAQHLDLLRPFSDKQRIYLSLMFLTLYTHTKPVKIAELLMSTIIPCLGQVSCDIGNFNIQKINQSEAEMVKSQLTKALAILEVTKANCKIALDKVEHRLCVSDPNHILTTLGNELDVYYNEIRTLDVPIAKDTLGMFKHKLVDFIDVRLLQVPNNNDDIQEKISVLHKKAKFVLDHLERINANGEVLTETETKIREIVDSSYEFEEKITHLEYWKEEKIDTINEAILSRKNDIVKKISGYIIAEGASYLRQKLIAVEDYKNYAQQFAFPKHIGMYNTKINEIKALKNCVDCLPKNNKLFKERYQVLEDRVEHVLMIIEKKANENERTLSELQTLQSILEEISNSEYRKVNLDVFNDYRRKIEAIDSFNSRIITKKLELLECLHNFEKQFYGEYFPQIEEILSPILDQYLWYMRTLIGTNIGENLSQRRQELTKCQTDIKNFFQANSASENTSTLRQVVDAFFNQLESVLQKNEELNKWIKDLDDIEVEVSNINDDELGSLRIKLVSLKARIRGNTLSNRLSNIEAEISIKESNIRLSDIINCNIERLKEDIANQDHQNNNTIFLDKISDIVILKEHIEEVPNENTEIDNLKTTALEQLYSILYSIDAQLAKFVFKKRQSENVLNVENYFNNLKVDDIPNKESIEFVQRVLALAETFEDSVKCYLGTKESVDYYIIHESLMRLLEELDELKCDDDALLDETAKAMAYIKQLKKQLLINATFPEF